MSSRRQRRQKREQRQKKGASPFKKWLPRVLLILILLLIAGIFIGYKSLRSYLQSEALNRELSQKLNQLIGTETLTLSPLQWDSWIVKADSLEASGSRQVKSLQLAGLDTELDLSGIKERTWKLNTLSIREAIINLGSPDSPKTTEKTPSTKKSSTFISERLPNKTTIEEIRIDRLSGQYATADSTYDWKNLSLDITPTPRQKAYQIEAQNGEITTPLALLPQLDLEEASARYNNGTLYLQEAHLLCHERGTLKLSGEIEKSRHHLEGLLENISTEEMLPPHWFAHLKGHITTDFDLLKKAGAPASTLSGKLFVNNATLTQLPLLDRLSAYADTTRFRRLSLSTAEFDYHKTGPQIRLINILLKSEGLLQLTGQLDYHLETKAINGTLNLGLTPGTLARIPGAETKVFLPGKDQLLWSPIRISGTLDQLNEDLSDRLIAAAIDRMFEIIPETGELVLRHSGRLAGETATSLLTESGKLIEPATQVVETAIETTTELTQQALEKSPELIEKAADTAIDSADAVLETGTDLLDGLLGN